MKELKIVILGDKGTGKTCLLLSYVHTAMPEQYLSTAFDHYRSEISLDGTNTGINLWDTGGRDDYDRLRGLVLQNAHVVLLVYSVDSPLSMQNIRAKWALMARHHAPDTPVILVGAKLDIRSGGAVEVKDQKEPARITVPAASTRKPTVASTPAAAAKSKDNKTDAKGGSVAVDVGPQPSRDPPGNRTVIVMGQPKPRRARAAKAAVKLVSVEDAMALSNELRAVRYMECSAKTQNGLKGVIDEAIQQAAAYEKRTAKCTIL